MKSEGVVHSKQEFWYEMDLIDLESAGAFVPREIWDKFVLKKNPSKLVMTPTDFTKRKRN